MAYLTSELDNGSVPVTPTYSRFSNLGEFSLQFIQSNISLKPMVQDSNGPEKH